MLKPARQGSYLMFLFISVKLCWKRFVLVRSEILGLFFNTLTANQMYSRQNWEKLPQQVEAKLSSNPEILFQIFIAFFKAT